MGKASLKNSHQQDELLVKVTLVFLIGYYHHTHVYGQHSALHTLAGYVSSKVFIVKLLGASLTMA